jgi:hypothetical protein
MQQSRVVFMYIEKRGSVPLLFDSTYLKQDLITDNASLKLD